MSTTTKPSTTIKDLAIVPKGKKDASGDWTQETRVNAALALTTLGNLREVERLTGVPMATLNLWRKQPWWEQLMAEHKQDERNETSSKLQNIVIKAIDIVEDRLKNGDYILNNKTGQIIRKQVGVKDASNVLKDILDKKIKLETLQMEERVVAQSVPEILKTLATEFAKFNKKQSKELAVDIPFVERTQCPS